MSTVFKHNPLDFATALSAKLASRSRHVCAFLGAGSAQACGLPGVEQLQQALKAGDQEAFQCQLKECNLEGALTRIRRIAALVSDEEQFDGLTNEKATTLDAAAIFPSDTKYEESRRVPFVVLQDRFRRALHEPETLILISGYSFSGEWGHTLA